MKQNLFKLLRTIVMSAIVVFSFAACKGDEPENPGNGEGNGSGDDNTPAKVAVTGVTLSPATLSLIEGETGTLSATVSPSDASNAKIAWSSDKPAVATVADGLVTAVSEGSAKITVTTEDGGFTASCEVSVSAPTPTYSMAPVDLGLSVKWAESNLGTIIPAESGEYYAWSETDPVPGLCGKAWRMPTKAEFEELINQCDMEETKQGSIKGYKITSKSNGNSIFLPAAGYKKGGELNDNQDYGYYWSSTACENVPAAWYLDFMMEGHKGTPKTVTSNGEQVIYSGSDLKFELWTEKGNGSLTYYPDGSYKMMWNNSGDALGKLGLKFDRKRRHEEIGHFAADYKFTKQGNAGSFSYIGIYGWTGPENIVEFYIVEDQFSRFEPYECNRKGEYEVDGDTYVFYAGNRYNAPNVFGTTANFPQYYGVRKSFRQKGHVDITAHFKQWEKWGYTLGNLESVMVLAEAGGGQGSVDFSYVNIYPQASFSSWLEANELTGADAAWDATPAKWGGEVTNAYMYNQGKDQPVRFPAGPDPYLNLREQTLLQSIRPVRK